MDRLVTLRTVRLERGLNPLQIAAQAECPVDTVVHAEFGTRVPIDAALRRRLAEAYGIPVKRFLDLAFDAADRWAARQSG